MIREICKAGWLQQKIEKRSGVNKWTKAPKWVYLPEKWYVLCVHDDRSPFLEVYSNDEGVNRHEPLETLNLNECQYITTAIEDERTFVIAFQNDGRTSLELAALSALERREWMEMLRFKLVRLGCLESGSNIYSPFPMTASQQPPVQASETPEAREEVSTTGSFAPAPVGEDNAVGHHTYEPPRRTSIIRDIVNASVGQEVDRTEPMAPVVSRLSFSDGLYEPISHVAAAAARSRSRSPGSSENVNGTVEEEDSMVVIPAGGLTSMPGYSMIKKPILPPRNGSVGATWFSSISNSTPMEITHRRQTSISRTEDSTYDVPRAMPMSPLESYAPSSSPPRPPPPPVPPARSSFERYDSLPMENTIRRSIDETVVGASVTDSANNNAEYMVRDGVSGISSSPPRSQAFDNGGFHEDNDPTRYANGRLRDSLDTEFQFDAEHAEYHRIFGQARRVPASLLNAKSPTSPPASINATARPNFSSAMSSTVRPNPPSNFGRRGMVSRNRSVRSIEHSSFPLLPIPAATPGNEYDRTPSPPTSPPPAPPLPPPNGSTPIGTGRAVALKEMEVAILKTEMDSSLPVKLQVQLDHLMNENGHLMGLALVDLLGYVWVAGWFKPYTSRFSPWLHIGDRLDSISDADGKAAPISSTAKAEQLLRECWKRRCNLVSLFVKRLPLGQVFVMKRTQNGENVGIILKENKKNEIVSIEEGKAACNAGMQAQRSSTMNNGVGMVNMFVTEVNGRPLNMFFRNGEAIKRLNASGTEISIVVHPSDFVKELRNKLKKKKDYKEYVNGV